jgi:hypothetical protein
MPEWPATQTLHTQFHAEPNTPVRTPSLQIPGIPQTPHASSVDATVINTIARTPSRLTTLSPNPAYAPYATPAWCPTQRATPIEFGKLRIAYANPDGLWIWEEESAVKQLENAGDIQQVLISNDGLVIVFIRLLDENRAELWAINADGSNERRLVSAEEFTRLDGSKDALGVMPDSLQWEPNSHHLTFFTYPIYHTLWIFQPIIPWLVDVDTGILSTAPYQGGHIGYSPDGKHVAIYNPHDLSLSNTDGSNYKGDILDSYHGITMGESTYSPIPKWSEDSKSLMVALPDQDEIYTSDATVTVWQVPVEGTPVSIGHWRAFSPSVSFSLKLTTMAYWSWPEGTANQRILHLARLDDKTDQGNTDLIYIQGEMVDFLAWSPDSQHFMFSMTGSNAKKQLYIGNICWLPVLVMESGNLGTAAWIDDSHYIYAIQQDDFSASWELHLGKISQGQSDVLGVVTTYDWAILP